MRVIFLIFVFLAVSSFGYGADPDTKNCIIICGQLAPKRLLSQGSFEEALNVMRKILIDNNECSNSLIDVACDSQKEGNKLFRFPAGPHSEPKEVKTFK